MTTVFPATFRVSHNGEARLSKDLIVGNFVEVQVDKPNQVLTVNRDLTLLRKMLRLAERKRFITHSPFVEIGLLEERKQRRGPHIVTFEEAERILAVAAPHIRANRGLDFGDRNAL